MTTLERIRAACIAANPEFADREDYELRRGPRGGLGIYSKYHPIRLADVLLAIGKFYESCLIVSADGEFMDYGFGKAMETGHAWNLRTDDLEHQSPETIEFIAKVLGV